MDRKDTVQIVITYKLFNLIPLYIRKATLDIDCMGLDIPRLL